MSSLVALVVAATSLVNMSGCTSVADDRYPPPAVSIPPPESLFSSDSAVLSDDEIRRILAYDFRPGTQNRVAVLALGTEYGYGWSEDLAAIGKSSQNNLIARLESADAITKASYLPSFLIPEKRTVAFFREAAARYQADLLLIYRSSCRTFERYQILRADSSKASCSIEAALLEVRTGIVPFTIVTSREAVAEKKPDDSNFQETIRRVQAASVGEALVDMGGQVTAFLDGSARK